jgi:protein-L-isoaspartate(D-aspartate) O-methyltransferase
VTRRGVLLLSTGWVLPGQDRFAAQRETMVREQIAGRGIKNPRVLQALRVTPREIFLPPEVRGQAYEDHPVPIGYGQTMSQPYIVAFMTEALDVGRQHRVLEIGTGSGYQAAILAGLAKDVYTIEIVPQLAASSAEKLKRYSNVHVRQGDGYQGWPEHAPFDRIILTAAPPELPEALVNQLARPGKLIAPVGEQRGGQELRLVEKAADGKVSSRAVLPVSFVPMVRPGR